MSVTHNEAQPSTASLSLPLKLHLLVAQREYFLGRLLESRTNLIIKLEFTAAELAPEKRPKVPDERWLFFSGDYWGLNCIASPPPPSSATQKSSRPKEQTII